MDYSAQVQRIKEKLKLAAQRDRELVVFGASSHRYIIHSPVSPRIIAEFEQKFAVELPEAYKVFLTEIGNGGVSYDNSAAGPYYGIYDFNKGSRPLLYNEEKYLSRPARIFPHMTDEAWDQLNERINANSEISDEDYEKELDTIFQGLLDIGSQGCTYEMALVVSGEYKGRIVYLDFDRHKPFFTFEDNFLDWYERWLDEIISGWLLTDGATWFATTMGGNDVELIGKYRAAADPQTKIDCLSGFFKLTEIQPQSALFLRDEYQQGDQALKDTIMQLLVKFDYPNSRRLLQRYFEAEPLKSFQYIFWYAKAHSDDWIDEIRSTFGSGTADVELLRFCAYVAAECREDLSALIEPYTKHSNEAIRSQANYAISKERLKGGKD